MKFELFIGRRYFQSKPAQAIIALITVLSIVGVIIGVTALIVVIGVMAGFESDLKDRILGIEPHLIIDNEGKPLANYENIVAAGRRLPGIKAIWPVVEFDAMLRTDTRVAGALVKGVDAESAENGLQISSLKALDPGVNEQPGDTLPPIVIGQDLARSMGLFINDTVFIVPPRMALVPGGFIPYMKRFRVAAYFQTKMYEFDGRLIFMRLNDAQSLARLQNAVSSVEVRVDDIFNIPSIEKQLKAIVHKGYRYRDWRQLNKNLFSALKLEKIAMFITLTLIILVATFSIASSLVMLVMEKTKDIAILKAMGATNAAIRRIFIFQGMLIGVIGTALGVLIGTSLCYFQERYQWVHLPGDAFYISALPIDLQMSDIVIVALSALVICFLATLYPAHQASRFSPVEALRYG